MQEVVYVLCFSKCIVGEVGEYGYVMVFGNQFFYDCDVVVIGMRYYFVLVFVEGVDMFFVFWIGFDQKGFGFGLCVVVVLFDVLVMGVDIVEKLVVFGFVWD